MSPTTVATTTTTTIETATKIAKGDCNVDCKTTTATTTMATTTPTGVAARLARANILELSPYRCARDDYSEGILLDANENAYGPAMATKKNHDNDEEELELHRYPDPYQIPLKLRLAKLRSGKNSGGFLTPAHFFIGVGSDEAIDLLMRIFCKPGHDAILTTPPTYGMYKVCAKVNDVDVVTVPLTPDFDVVIPNVRIIFLILYFCLSALDGCLRSLLEHF
jgi:histidinol-phosphate aminotransferase